MEKQTIQNEGFKHQKGDFRLTYYIKEKLVRYDYDSSYKIFKLGDFLQHISKLKSFDERN